MRRQWIPGSLFPSPHESLGMRLSDMLAVGDINTFYCENIHSVTKVLNSCLTVDCSWYCTSYPRVIVPYRKLYKQIPLGTPHLDNIHWHSKSCAFTDWIDTMYHKITYHCSGKATEAKLC